MVEERGRLALWMVGLVVALAGAALLVGMRVQQRAETKAAALEERRVRVEALAKMRGLVVRWGDAEGLARSTPRAGLSAQIGALQAIRQEVAGLQAAGCAAEAQGSLTRSMGTSLDAFMLFLSGGSSREEFADSDAVARQQFEEYVSQEAACSQK